MADEGSLAGTFNFRITLTRSDGRTPAELGDGGFQECSGLDIEMDVQELQEGGFNNGVVRRVGDDLVADTAHGPRAKIRPRQPSHFLRRRSRRVRRSRRRPQLRPPRTHIG